MIALSALAVLLGVIVLGGFARAPTDTARTSPSPSAVDAAPLGLFQRDGFRFLYPPTWHSYPMQMAASFFSVEGYLASEPIDMDRVCTFSENSTSCNFRGYDLHPGNVAIEIAGWGIPMDDPLAFWDRPAEGRRILVAGVPAISLRDDVGPDRVVLTWKISQPDALGSWVQIDADILGPNSALAMAQVDALVASFRFDAPPQHLDPALAGRTAEVAMQQLRRMDFEAYACFPPLGHTVAASITAVPSMQLTEPVDGSCGTAITATDLGFWRLDLTVTWGTDPERPDHRYVTQQWLMPDGTPTVQTGHGDPLPFCCRQ